MRTLTTAASVLLLALLLTTATQAAPLLDLPDLQLSAVAGTGSTIGIGGCLSYPVLKGSNATFFADLGLLVDGDVYSGFVGVSTDKPIPLVDKLPGNAAAGFGYSFPESGVMVYLRYELF